MTGSKFEFDQVFDEDYLYFYGPPLEEVAEQNAELIWRLLDLRPGSRTPDLACGHGRIANRLAQRGALMSGLDASPLFLDRAVGRPPPRAASACRPARGRLAQGRR